MIRTESRRNGWLRRYVFCFRWVRISQLTANKPLQTHSPFTVKRRTCPIENKFCNFFSYLNILYGAVCVIEIKALELKLNDEWGWGRERDNGRKYARFHLRLGMQVHHRTIFSKECSSTLCKTGSCQSRISKSAMCWYLKSFIANTT